MSFGSGEVSLVAAELPPQLAGRRVSDLTSANRSTRRRDHARGSALIPTLGTEFRAGDLIHVAVLSLAMERLEALLGLGRGM
jgi:trk system potassium uptake protein TrkA